jgi:hypothetical protein
LSKQGSFFEGSESFNEMVVEAIAQQFSLATKMFSINRLKMH